MSLPKHLAGLFTLLLSVSPIAALAAPLYSITTLDNIGSNSSSPAGMNNSGQAVGYASDGSNLISAFVSNGGVMKNLNPPGALSSYAWGINNAGVAVGQVETGTTTRAVTFSGGTVADLGSLGGSTTSSYGSAINNSGQVAGVSYLAGTSGDFHAFRYAAGAMLDVGTLGGANSYGRGINDAGSVVGYAELAGGAGSHAFRYVGGSMVDLGSLGGTFSDAYAINASGTVIGLSWLAGDTVTRAFMHSGGGMIDLGSLGGDTNSSYAYGINSAGQVVGGSEFSAGKTEQYAFLYSGGGMIDLNTLIDPTSGWTLDYAAAINDNNQILAHGCTRAGCQGLLLTLADPVVGAVPEPGTLALAALGLAALGWTRKRKGQKQAACEVLFVVARVRDSLNALADA